MPVVGVVKRAAMRSMARLVPAIYPPVGAIPDPGFLMSDPMMTSAPTSVGSCRSVNSP